MTSSNHEPAGDPHLMDDVEFLDLDADSPAPSDTDAPGMEIVDRKKTSPEKKKPHWAEIVFLTAVLFFTCLGIAQVHI